MAFGISSVRAYPVVAESPFRGKSIMHMVEVGLTASASDSSLALATLAASDSDGAALKTLLARAAKIEHVAIPGLVEASQYPVLKYDSAASAGGAASEAYTVTGLAAADEILSVSPLTKGANAVYIRQWTDTGRSVNTLTVEYSGDPGAGAKVRVLARKAAASAPAAGAFSWDGNANTPTFLLPGGTSTPTAFTLYLLIREQPDMDPVYSEP